MTRDEKIEALAEELRNVARGGPPEPMWTVVARSVQDRIDAAGTRWTRVEDGLPEHHQEVNVTVKFSDESRCVRKTYGFPHSETGWWWHDITARGWCVLAWAPIPEPWRG